MKRLATAFSVEEGSVKVTASALIRGDGIDLVVQRPGRRSITVQLSMANAHKLAGHVQAAADESAEL